MEKIIRVADSLVMADEMARADDKLLSPQERFNYFMLLMEPYYAASSGLQRILRIDDRTQRRIHDDWGVRIQSLQKP